MASFRRRIPILGMAGVLAIVGLAGCAAPVDPVDPTTPAAVADPNEGGGEAWQAVVAAANKEGEVVVYVALPGIEERLQQGFNEYYPDIKVTVLRQSTTDLITRLDQERTTGASGADVAIHGALPWFNDNAADLVQNEGPMYPKYWEGSDISYNDGLNQMVTATAYGLLVNDQLVEELGAHPIETPEDLFQDQLKGAVGIVPAETGSIGQRQWWYFATEALGGASALQDLKALEPTKLESGVPLSEAVIAGEYAAGIYSSQSTIATAQKAGAPVRIVNFDPPIVFGLSAGIVGWATHPNAAQVFHNWLISPAGQNTISAPGDVLSPTVAGTFGDLVPADQSVPAGTPICDGILTDEQKAWFEKEWTPILG